METISEGAAKVLENSSPALSNANGTGSDLIVTVTGFFK